MTEFPPFKPSVKKYFLEDLYAEMKEKNERYRKDRYKKIIYLILALLSFFLSVGGFGGAFLLSSSLIEVYKEAEGTSPPKINPSGAILVSLISFTTAMLILVLPTLIAIKYEKRVEKAKGEREVIKIVMPIIGPLVKLGEECRCTIDKRITMDQKEHKLRNTFHGRLKYYVLEKLMLEMITKEKYHLKISVINEIKKIEIFRSPERERLVIKINYKTTEKREKAKSQEEMSKKIAEVQKEATKITNKVFVKKRKYQIPMKYNGEKEEVIIRIRAQRKNLKLEAVGEVIGELWGAVKKVYE